MPDIIDDLLIQVPGVILSTPQMITRWELRMVKRMIIPIDILTDKLNHKFPSPKSRSQLYNKAMTCHDMRKVSYI